VCLLDERQRQHTMARDTEAAGLTGELDACCKLSTRFIQLVPLVQELCQTDLRGATERDGLFATPDIPLDQTQRRLAGRGGLPELAVLNQHLAQVKTRQQGGHQAAACLTERAHPRTPGSPHLCARQRDRSRPANS